MGIALGIVAVRVLLGQALSGDEGKRGRERDRVGDNKTMADISGIGDAFCRLFDRND